MREPLALVMSAESVIQKYGPTDRFDIVAHLPKVSRPTLVVIDARSPASSPAFAGLPEAVQSLRATTPSIELHLPPKTDIGYRNSEIDIAAAIDAWRKRRASEMDAGI